MKLTTKFTLIFSAIVLFMGYISFYGIYSFQYRILQQDITDKLENAAAAHLDRLDRMFYERLQDLALTARSPAFHSGAQAIRRELGDFLQRYPQYVSISYYTLDRVAVADAGAPRGAFTRHPLTEYWPDIYAGKDAVVNISRSATLHAPTLHFAVRVTDAAGGTRGVLVARIPASEMYGLMESTPDPAHPAEQYQVDVLDHDGTVLYSNHNSQAILRAIDEDFGLIRDALPLMHGVGSLTEMHEVAHSAESPVLMVVAREQGYRNFNGNGWILKLMLPVDQAFASVAALNRHVFLFLFAISAVGIAAILTVLMITVVRPIKRLNRATEALGKGQLDTRVAIGAADEIGALAQSFNTMAANLREAREQLAGAAETALARASLAERKIIEISEETQRQIGRELHDDLGQQLTGVAFMAKGLQERLRSQDHAEAQNAARITTLISEAITKAQHLAHNLHPVEMAESDLRAMLMRLAANTQAIFGIKCVCTCEGEPAISAPLTGTNLFRIAQEAVHNAVKHSDATRITLKLTAERDALTMEITDNGRGIAAHEYKEGGLGMNSMRYRASVMNATLHIGAMSGGSTRVVVTLPAHGGVA